VVATATLNVPKVSAAKRYKLKKVTKALKAGEKAKLKFKLGKKVRKAAKRALAKGKKPKATIKVSAVDGAKNSTSKTLRVKLKK